MTDVFGAFPRRVVLDAQLAFLRNERARFQGFTDGVLSVIDAMLRLPGGAHAVNGSAFARFDKELRSYLQFRDSQFVGSPHVDDPSSVIEAAERTWKAAALVGISCAENTHGDRAKLLWGISRELGGVAEWFRYGDAIAEQLPDAHPAVKSTLRREQALYDRRSRTVAGELIMLASLQERRPNQEAADWLISNVLEPASRSERRIPTLSLPLMKPAELHVTLQQHRATIERIDERVAAQIADVERQRDLSPVPDSREVTMKLSDARYATDAETVLFFVAHDDDFISKFAAKALQLKEQSENTTRIVVAIATDGSGGDPQNRLHDTVDDHLHFFETRLQETIDSFAHVGVDEVVFMNYGDSGMHRDPSRHDVRLVDARAKDPNGVDSHFAQIMLRYNAHDVYTHGPLSEQLGNYSHPDHVAVTKCVLEAQWPLASVRATRPHLVNVHQVSLPESVLLPMFPGVFDGRQPLAPNVGPGSLPTSSEIVDVRHYRKAVEALAMYKSQVNMQGNAVLVGAPTDINTPGVAHWTTNSADRIFAKARERRSSFPIGVFLNADTSSPDIVAIRNRFSRHYPTVGTESAGPDEVVRLLNDLRSRGGQPIVFVSNKEHLQALSKTNGEVAGIVAIEPSKWAPSVEAFSDLTTGHRRLLAVSSPETVHADEAFIPERWDHLALPTDGRLALADGTFGWAHGTFETSTPLTGPDTVEL